MFNKLKAKMKEKYDTDEWFGIKVLGVVVGVCVISVAVYTFLKRDSDFDISDAQGGYSTQDYMDDLNKKINNGYYDDGGEYDQLLEESRHRQSHYIGEDNIEHSLEGAFLTYEESDRAILEKFLTQDKVKDAVLNMNDDEDYEIALSIKDSPDDYSNMFSYSTYKGGILKQMLKKGLRELLEEAV